MEAVLPNSRDIIAYPPGIDSAANGEGEANLELCWQI